MSDEQENVDAGSEPSGDTTDTAQADTAETTATDTAQADQEAADAGAAAEQEQTQGAEPQVGDACTCPDGRAGTVVEDPEGALVCLPNQG